jgi:hypothetical protein
MPSMLLLQGCILPSSIARPTLQSKAVTLQSKAITLRHKSAYFRILFCRTGDLYVMLMDDEATANRRKLNGTKHLASYACRHWTWQTVCYIHTCISFACDGNRYVTARMEVLLRTTRVYRFVGNV